MTSTAVPRREACPAGSQRPIFHGFTVDVPRSPSGRAVLLHRRRPVWTLTNPTGAWIARRMDGTLSRRDIAASLAERWGTAPERAEADLDGFLGAMHAQGFLDPSPNDPAAGGLPPLRSVFLTLTSRCNLSCAHCYVSAGPEKEEGARGSSLPVERVLGIIDELARLGGTGVTLSGGEPFAYPGIERVLAHAAGRGLEVRLLTNGTMIGEKEAEFLARHGSVVQVSVDGASADVHDRIRGEGSFERALQGIRRLREARPEATKLYLCATILDSNLPHLLDLFPFALSVGAVGLRFLPPRPEGRAGGKWADLAGGLDTRALADFYREALASIPRFQPLEVSIGLSGVIWDPEEASPGKGSWCPIGRSLAIDSDGEAYACVPLMQEARRLGSLMEKPLGEVHSSDAHARFYREIAERRDRVADCRACWLRSFCQGGCGGMAVARSGDLFATDGLCDLRREVFLDGIASLARAEGETSGKNGELRHAPQ